MWEYNYNDELYHYGVVGMKWGVRRYQNSDGSLTSAGKKRYSGEKKAHSKKAYLRERNRLFYENLDQKLLEREHKEHEKVNILERLSSNPYISDAKRTALSKQLSKAYDEYFKAVDETSAQAREATLSILISKYGDKKVNRWESRLDEKNRY